MAEEKKSYDEEDYDDLSRDIIKRELLSKLERKFNDKDPAIMNTLKEMLNESDNMDDPFGFKKTNK